MATFSNITLFPENDHSNRSVTFKIDSTVFLNFVADNSKSKQYDWNVLQKDAFIRNSSSIELRVYNKGQCYLKKN